MVSDKKLKVKYFVQVFRLSLTKYGGTDKSEVYGYQCIGCDITKYIWVFALILSAAHDKTIIIRLFVMLQSYRPPESAQSARLSCRHIVQDVGL